MASKVRAPHFMPSFSAQRAHPTPHRRLSKPSPTRVTDAMAETANETSATVTIQQQQQNGSAETGRSPTEAQVGGESAQQEASPPVLTLRLRPRPSVTWGADVINNEGMGKKSSKRECGKEGGAAGNIFLSEAQKQQEEEGRNVSFFTESGAWCDSCS